MAVCARAGAGNGEICIVFCAVEVTVGKNRRRGDRNRWRCGVVRRAAGIAGVGFHVAGHGLVGGIACSVADVGGEVDCSCGERIGIHADRPSTASSHRRGVRRSADIEHDRLAFCAGARAGNGESAQQTTQDKTSECNLGSGDVVDVAGRGLGSGIACGVADVGAEADGSLLEGL